MKRSLNEIIKDYKRRKRSEFRKSLITFGLIAGGVIAFQSLTQKSKDEVE